MVRTKYGQIKGMEMSDYIEYRGVPYAMPPIGDLRWKAPQRLQPWTGVLDAVNYGNICMQENMESAPYSKDFNNGEAYVRKMSEDCLYLNIWTPKEHHSDSAYPVAMWLHGGAFMGGYATESEFDGSVYAKKGVIVVSVEYRCNIFGFLAHPWLSEENEQHISGNYGILDQIAALDWIKENIAAFGGNPENITVFGQSAGAMSVQTLVSSPLCKNKIQRAIMQSGGSYGVGLHRDIPLEEQEKYGKMYTDMMQISNLEELRKLPADTIENSIGQWFGQVMPLTKGLFLTPTLDGYVLDGGYYELIKNGKIADIPYMLGAVKDDIDVMGKEDNIHEETMLLRGSKYFSYQLEALGRFPAYVYYFTHELPGDDWGAYHSAELFYMFGTLDTCWRPWTERDYRLSEKMIQYWANFMKTGNPNSDDLPQWQACSKNTENMMIFS